MQNFYGFESWSGSLVRRPSIVNSMDGGDSLLSSASKAETTARSVEACNSHKEAERRRRQRINAHLSTLRTLLPNTTKTDKASLLAEVVSHVKELRKQAADVALRNRDLMFGGTTTTITAPGMETEAWPFPSESDELRLSYCFDESEARFVKATLCCEDRPGLNGDLMRAIRSVRGRAVRAETTTVGGRTKNVVFMEWAGRGDDDVRTLKRALKAVVENRASGYGLDQMVSGSKRVRVYGSFGGADEEAQEPVGLHHQWRLQDLRWETIFTAHPFLVLPIPLWVQLENAFLVLTEAEGTHLGLLSAVKRNLAWRLEASGASSGSLAKDLINFKKEDVPKANSRADLFSEMKQRFLSFKKHKYLEEPEHFRTLAEAQEPKFMVISCADSRVCPSNILGFQPGEAFIIRNVANLVPPLENGPSETNAALEFAVNTLQVEHILVIGHSRCGGIETLMSLQDDDDDDSSLVHSWILKAKVAKLRTKAAAPNLNFDQQCRHCEQESINISLMNLLTYPWIEERVKKDKLSIHGGYYDFLNCTFEKWTLDVRCTSNNTEQVARHSAIDYWV
ncbi:hypothetical protein FNV43_RR12418 [Rhamnella rubrinervis]|uniref:carbonic anhydrase n=1 Tax=Rhamnella rubrinervis TaxID=2594499 RepID=A0A8K0H8C5_9ROSA|nr:hypothetical protein FNV43_RR12418 [Rhamnella rubrinervis]